MECKHKNVEKCHYTYITYFKPAQEETCEENKNPSRIFPPDFDILSETLEFLIEGHVFAQGQKADSEGEAARI